MSQKTSIVNRAPVLNVSRYALLQVFTKFGKIAKLDFLFHKSGINKGKPRGYAFVEFMNEAVSGRAPLVVLVFFLTFVSPLPRTCVGRRYWLGYMSKGFIPGDIG